jgi:hypothetical protein
LGIGRPGVIRYGDGVHPGSGQKGGRRKSGRSGADNQHVRFSRPTFYKSQSALDAGGLSALLPALAVAIRRVEAIAMTPNAP